MPAELCRLLFPAGACRGHAGAMGLSSKAPAPSATQDTTPGGSLYYSQGLLEGVRPSDVNRQPCSRCFSLSLSHFFASCSLGPSPK